MLLRNGLKGLIADRPTSVGIIGRAQAECEGYRVASHSCLPRALRTLEATAKMSCEVQNLIPTPEQPTDVITWMQTTHAHMGRALDM
jgi:hypothetical protein